MWSLMVHHSGFDDNAFGPNPKTYFTHDFISKNMQFGIVQLLVSREPVVMGAHSFQHWSNNQALKAFILTAPKCALTFSLGQVMPIAMINKMAAVALRSSRRVHLHIGSAKMTLWARKRKPALKVRNTLRSPLIIINKV